MCGRYSNVARLKVLRKRFRFETEKFSGFDFEPKYNIAPTDSGMVVLKEGDERVARWMTFGLVPHWAKDVSIGLHCLNARSETVAEKPAFRDSLKKRRCLVLSDGFYEWRKEGKIKIPFRMVLKDREPFAFAGLWDRWTGKSGNDLYSFTIITTVANELIKPFHDRMPVILNEVDEDLWLAPHNDESKTLLPLLKPFPSEQMEMYEVSRYVNVPGNKGAEAIVPFENPR